MIQGSSRRHAIAAVVAIAMTTAAAFAQQRPSGLEPTSSAARLKTGQAPGSRPQTTRLTIDARTRALFLGSGLPGSLNYLADVPLEPRRGVPSLAKQDDPQTILTGSEPDRRKTANDSLYVRTSSRVPAQPPRLNGGREARRQDGSALASLPSAP